MSHQTASLPTLQEVLAALPGLLLASGELAPRTFHGQVYDMQVVPELNPSFSNPDFDPDLSGLSAADRAFMARQRHRSFQEMEAHVSGRQPWRWVIQVLPGGRLAAPDWKLAGDPTGMLHVDVPMFTIDRSTAFLSGQRHGTEDFVHWMRRAGPSWSP